MKPTAGAGRGPANARNLMNPERLRGMSDAELVDLAALLRRRILETCLKNGGHLGASLGAVEIAIALHAVFESPAEPVIWDVGHQAYAHKLLTGRWENFGSLRQEGGISGFLSRREGPHDVFGAGHSSTSLSAALAMAWAARRMAAEGGRAAPWTVAVIGDGGLTAGLAFEALNNFLELPRGPVLVVLNDNRMSISPNTGAIPSILASGGAGEFFTRFGFSYLGPGDGHDLPALVRELRRIRAAGSERPVLFHLITRKGKGHEPAERLPVAFHGMNPAAEKAPASHEHGKPPRNPSFSEVAGATLLELAERNSRVVAISAAMVDGSGLSELARRFPDRAFDVGIAEAHAVTFAAGLATRGYRAAVCIYSTFLQRGIDSIIHDVALQNLPVTFLVDRAGVVGSDGPTHHGAFDLVYLSMIPNVRVSAPATLSDLRLLIRQAFGAERTEGAWAIRYPRGTGPEELPASLDPDGLRWHQTAPDPGVIAVALGTPAERLARASRAVDPEGRRITAVSCIHAKPIPGSLLELLARNPRSSLLTVEEGVVRGGFGSALRVAAELAGPRAGRVDLAGYGDRFIPQGSPSAQEAWEGLSEAALAERLKKLLST